MSQVFRPFEPMVIVTAENGKTDIPASTPLTRLHYFDGKFLRASDLSLEQVYMQALSNLSNQAGGTGVVHGFDTSLSSDGADVVIGAGMAIDPLGRVLLLPGGERRFRIADLIPLTARAHVPPRNRYVGPGSFEECVTVSEAPASRPTEGFNLYLITIGHAEALCGNEDVYGKICEEACITSSDRPLFREGVIVRAEPLILTAGMPASGVVTLQDRHLRSRLASAVFAMEDARVPSLISAAGLNSEGWCLGARLGGGTRVPLAVIARMGATTIFLDAWTVRRERIEAPSKRYWAARMSMRPWDVFLAQVLQFQCHLVELLDEARTGGTLDPCRDMRDVVRDTVNTIGDLIKKPLPPAIVDVGPRPAPAAPALALPLTQIADLHLKLDRFLKPGLIIRRRNGMLIDGGIVELPPAGYLPVSAGQVVNDQVRAIVGPGLDLRYCVVTPDFVAHALEEAQHMDRISLLEGLEPGATRPPVDVLIPDGELLKPVAPAAGIGFEGEVYVRPDFQAVAPPPPPAPPPASPLPPAPPLTSGPTPPPGIPFFAADIADIGERVRASLDDFGRLREIEILEPMRPRPTAGAVQVLGAGRAEQLATGGGAFHFAGISEASNKLKIADFVNGLAAIGRDAPDDLKTLQKLPLEELSGAAGKIPSTLYQRANTVGGTASLFTGGLRSKFAGAIDEIVRPEMEDLPTFEIPTVAAEKRLVTVWTSMRCDRNPFELAEEQSTRVDLNITVGIPGKKASWVDYRVQGDFTVGAVQRSGSVSMLKGFVHGGSAHTRAIVDGGAPADYHDTGDISVSCQLEDTLKRKQLTVRVRHGKVNAFLIDVSWGGSPLQMHVGVTYDRKGALADTVLLNAALHRNDAVLSPGHPRHALALSAVNVTGALIKRPEFANRATQLLFPPAPPPPKEIRIRATRDWVMFHRRRTKNCAVAEAVAPAPPRRYQLWHVQVPDAAAVEQMRTALLTNNPAGLPPFSPVTPVEFAGGAAVLTSNADNIRHDWARDARGNILQYSLIASQGTLEGDQMARARLAQVQAVLQPGVMPDAKAVTDVLPFVPGMLAVPETDGAILLVTRSQAKTTCHNVYHVLPQLGAQAMELLKDHQIVALTGVRGVTLLGKLEFKGDSAELTTSPADRQQVINNWKTRADGRIARVMGFTNASDPVASGEPHLTNRVKAIATMLGNADGIVTAGAIAAAMPDGCAGATFVIPTVTKHLVLTIDKNLKDVTPTVPSLLSSGNLGGLLKYAKLLGEVPFVGGTDQALPGPVVQSVAAAYPGATATEVFTYSQPGGAPESALMLQAQGTHIAGRAGVPGLPVTVPNVVATGWPSAEFLHVSVIAVQSTTLTEHLVVAIDVNQPDITPPLPEALKKGMFSTILKYAHVLGDAMFISGSSNAPVPLALHPLAAAFPSAVIATARVLIYTKPGGTADTAALAQGDQIANAVGAAGATVAVIPDPPAEWPSPSALHVSVIAITKGAGRITVGPGFFTPGVRGTVLDRLVVDPGALDPLVTPGPAVVPGVPIRVRPQGGRAPAAGQPRNVKTPRRPKKPKQPDR